MVDLKEIVENSKYLKDALQKVEDKGYSIKIQELNTGRSIRFKVIFAGQDYEILRDRYTSPNILDCLHKTDSDLAYFVLDDLE